MEGSARLLLLSGIAGPLERKKERGQQGEAKRMKERMGGVRINRPSSRLRGEKDQIYTGDCGPASKIQITIISWFD